LQALRAVAVTVLSMLAAALAATAVFGVADRSWYGAVSNGLGALTAALAVALLFRAWVRHSPRHRGRH
jgi:uncharacterized membrane protein YdjX (TVP38/TMEM64 family)